MLKRLILYVTLVGSLVAMASLGACAPLTLKAVSPLASPTSRAQQSPASRVVASATTFSRASVWPDATPHGLPTTAFGKVPSVTEPGPHVRIDSFTLATSLPTAPKDMPVYQVGDCPDLARSLQSAIGDTSHWDTIPEYCLIQYRGETPLGHATAVSNPEEAQQRARNVVQSLGLWMPDNRALAAVPEAGGTWRVVFDQYVGGYPIYANKSLAVTLNHDGQVTSLIERRRPILASSLYLIRSPQDAWQDVQKGLYRTFFINDGAPSHDARIDHFTVSSVALVYLEPEVTARREVIQPFYAFRGTSGYVLYVPAIADPYLTGPEAE